jgi:putative ABC transport system permease protein
MLLRHAWKELFAEKRFALLFIFNLSLGLSGLVTMEAFRSSLSGSLRENSRNLLSADLAVSSRRNLNPEEIKLQEELAVRASGRTRLVETFSMVKSASASRLVLLRAVAENYPLRGFLDLEKQGKIGEGKVHSLLGPDRIWIDQDLSRSLKLKPGDTLKIGQADFTVADFVGFDPTQSFRALALAGRILLTVEGLERTGLIRPESTVSVVSLFRLPDSVNAESEAKIWGEKFRDPGVQVKAAGEAADDSARMLGYLGDFLGLSALVALFLSCLGSAYLFRTWLLRRSRVMAVHQVLGLKFWEAALIPGIQAFLLAGFAVPFALLLGRFELAALSALIRSLSPVEIPVALSLSSVAVAFAIAGGGSILLSLPFLASLRAANSRELLSGKIPEPKFTWLSLLLFLPAGALLYFLAVYEAQSYRNAAVFTGALLGALFALTLAGLLLLRTLGWVAARSRAYPWWLRQAFLQLSRRGFSSLSAFVALSLGALLLNLLPQLRHGLLSDLENPEQQKLPSLFLFDIQDDQIAPVNEMLAALGLKLDNQSPMVRARLLAVNGQPFERDQGAEGFRTREEENEARFRNRGFNLSYRAALNEAETIVAGEPFLESAEVNQVSVEERFAGRLGLKLGDLMKFDVQGVEVEGKVVNLRQVKWTSFQPNFFVLFQDGPLNGAPKIFLGSLRELPAETKDKVQSALAEKFPNVSVVDVRATVSRALDLADRMRWCLNLMSAISLFAGFVVLFSIANRQAELRRWDINLCKVLGAGASGIRAQQLAEFGLLSSAAGTFGSLISLVISWVTSYYLFSGVFSVDPWPVLLSIVGTTLLALTVSWLGARHVWRSSPAELLQEQPL